MTTINEALDGATPDPASDVTPEAPTPDSGQGVAEGTPTPEPDPGYFDPAEFADRKAKIKVQGEELEVPVPELVNGYMRQQDYTRKTQEHAQARAVWDRLNDPATAADTIQQLALQQLQRQRPAGQELPQDPIQRQLMEVQQRLDRVDALEEDRYLARELAFLKSEYGNDFVPEEVATRAYQIAEQTGYAPDLRSVFFQMQGERTWAKNSAQQQLDQERATADAAALAGKREAGQLAGGRSALGGGMKLEADEDLSVAEAFRRAQEIHGKLTFGT